MALNSISLAKDKNFILENWKPILGIGAALGVGFVGYKFYQHLTEDNNDLKINKNFEAPSITQSEANHRASILLAAMDQPGTDEAAILNALQGLTYNDFVLVSDAFGRKPYALGGYTPIPGVPGKNLQEWLALELGQSHINELRKVIPSAF